MMHIAGGIVLGLFIWHFVLPVALVVLAHLFRERPPKPVKPPKSRNPRKRAEIWAVFREVIEQQTAKPR
jgi:hypothetical protein